MSVTNLYGYKWIGNVSNLSTYPGVTKDDPINLGITFLSNNTKYLGITFSLNSISYETNTVYTNDTGWYVANTNIITIYGGYDIKSTSANFTNLYNWLNSNGTLVAPTAICNLTGMVSDATHNIKVIGKAPGYSPSDPIIKEDEPIISNRWVITHKIKNYEAAMAAANYAITSYDSTGNILETFHYTTPQGETSDGIFTIPTNTATLTFGWSNMVCIQGAGEPLEAPTVYMADNVVSIIDDQGKATEFDVYVDGELKATVPVTN